MVKTAHLHCVKIGHGTKKSARAALHKLVAAGQDRRALAVYRCFQCGRWHVGHIPDRRRR
jgi:hypothetical protein